MAWWDHEDLKDPRYKSDRYKVTFPEGYTDREVIEARERLGMKPVPDEWVWVPGGWTEAGYWDRKSK